jgi:hypothetical protein
VALDARLRGAQFQPVNEPVAVFETRSDIRMNFLEGKFQIGAWAIFRFPPASQRLGRERYMPACAEKCEVQLVNASQAHHRPM